MHHAIHAASRSESMPVFYASCRTHRAHHITVARSSQMHPYHSLAGRSDWGFHDQNCPAGPRSALYLFIKSSSRESEAATALRPELPALWGGMGAGCGNTSRRGGGFDDVSGRDDDGCRGFSAGICVGSEDKRCCGCGYGVPQERRTSALASQGAVQYWDWRSRGETRVMIRRLSGSGKGCCLRCGRFGVSWIGADVMAGGVGGCGGTNRRSRSSRLNAWGHPSGPWPTKR